MVLNPEDGVEDARRGEHTGVMSDAPFHGADLFREKDLGKQCERLILF